MHELSIAISLIEVATEELARQGGGRISAIHLQLGQLSGVVREALLSAYDLAAENTPLAGSQLVIIDVPVQIDCPQCRCPRPVESIQEMRCAVCKTPSANIIHGTELLVVALEICDEPAPVG